MVWVVKTTPRPLYFRETPGTHCIGGWVGPTAGLDWYGKSSSPPGFDRRTIQAVASRYTLPLQCILPCKQYSALGTARVFRCSALAKKLFISCTSNPLCTN
jgi:hypothetical protein